MLHFSTIIFNIYHDQRKFVNNVATKSCRFGLYRVMYEIVKL
jgi:hypothetical protein